MKIIIFLCWFFSFATQASTDLRSPEFKGPDTQRDKIYVVLKEVLSGLELPTDIQFFPDTLNQALILEKEGLLKWCSLNDGKCQLLLQLNVETKVEMGLLGLAFHPQFAENKKIYLNYNPKLPNKLMTRVSEWTLTHKDHDKKTAKLSQERVILEVEQPYTNHNAGQLRFGPDGYLYIGLGDGGSANDPQGHGQNTKTLLGSMLRLDVSKGSEGKAYSIPSDNPFVGKSGYLPEIWAYGLRNPWRYTFSPIGQLIVADVGQNKWEEISIVEKGKNYGWNVMEASHCFQTQDCSKELYTGPVYEYSHDEGQSLTGGEVYTGMLIPQLKGKYVFGDFVSGKLWAIDTTKLTPGQLSQKAYSLGGWPISPSTFGKDNQGELYIGDYGEGKIYQIIKGP